MLKYAKLVEYFRKCPKLNQLQSIASGITVGNTVILPNGSSNRVQQRGSIDTIDVYEHTVDPYLTVYQDYQINCYEFYDVKDTNPPQYNSNVLTLDEVNEVCEWIDKNDDNCIFPDAGETIVAMECIPFTPQVQYIDASENVIGYYITVRIHYINRKKKRVVEYDY